MFSTVTSSKKYSTLLVREVIVNLTKDFGKSASPSFGEVLVRGKKTMITPPVINEYYNSLNAQHSEPEPDFCKITKFITTDKKTSWVENKMSSTDLSKSTPCSMGLLFGTGIPTNTIALSKSLWLCYCMSLETIS